jgi:hypothetical protein
MEAVAGAAALIILIAGATAIIVGARNGRRALGNRAQGPREIDVRNTGDFGFPLSLIERDKRS